ncbi:receptor activity-modifying protein 2 isoform X2 [Brachyhypopomus gauderio]|uniref:receptor activity-modifying protein 2 isoform X2 n=1 Tax=Brachyhypopomus gauderio TaxID=698409 RepID=UPI004042B1C1
MHPCGSSPWSRPRWTPLVWIACMVFICSGSQALVPNVQKTSSVWTTLVPGGVQSTSLTPEDVRAEGLTKPCGNKTSTCADFCSLCDDFNLSRPDCYKITIVLCDGNFTNEMAALNSSNWCMWDKVKRIVPQRR